MQDPNNQSCQEKKRWEAPWGSGTGRNAGGLSKGIEGQVPASVSMDPETPPGLILRI